MPNPSRNDDADDAAPPKRNWGPRLALLGVFAVTGFSIFGGELLLAPEPGANVAPTIGLTDLEGETVEVNLGDLPTVVLLSEVTCATCAGDLEAFEAASRRWRDKVTFLAVAPEPEADLTAVTERLGLTFSLAVDAGGAVAARYGTDPEKQTTFVFVSATGRILDRERGPIAADTLERRIRGLISAGPGRNP